MYFSNSIFLICSVFVQRLTFLCNKNRCDNCYNAAHAKDNVTVKQTRTNSFIAPNLFHHFSSFLKVVNITTFHDLGANILVNIFVVCCVSVLMFSLVAGAHIVVRFASHAGDVNIQSLLLLSICYFIDLTLVCLCVLKVVRVFRIDSTLSLLGNFFKIDLCRKFENKSKKMNK